MPDIQFEEIILSENERQLNYFVSCADKIEILPNLGIMKNNNGIINIKPIKNISYTLTATNKTQKDSSILSIKYPLPKQKSKPALTASVTQGDANDSNGISNYVEILAIFIIIGIVLLLNRIITKNNKS